MFWLTLGALLVKMLTNVAPRWEAVVSWTEDELATVLREASHDLGVSQKTFMTVLRHEVSGIKVCKTPSCRSLDTHSPDRLEPG